MLKIFTDTDTDLTPAKAAEYGYSLISMPYAIDGQTTYPYEDFDVFDDHAFYQKLREGVLPNTSAISEEKYIAYFEPVFAAGDDILYVHFSAAMTMTFDVMKRAVDRLSEKYPDRKFYTIDTMGITLLSYNIVCEIGQLYKDGKTVDEILAWAKEEVLHFAVYFFADDLKFFHHSGRVGGLSATMGTLLGIRPIIYMNDEGKMVSVGKERGRARAMERLASMVDELGDKVTEHTVAIGHADAPDLANELADMIRARYGENVKIDIVPVNPTAGSHCGPDTVGICFHAIHR